MKEKKQNEEKDNYFNNIEKIVRLIKDNAIFNNAIDSEKIRYNQDQYDCLSSVMALTQFMDFCFYLYGICSNANQVKRHEFGGYSYIKFKNDIFCIHCMSGQGTICQFVLVDKIPDEDKDCTLFDIENYGLETIGELYKTNTEKCISNICKKYNIELKDNPNLYPNEDFYYVSPGKVAYHFQNCYDLNIKKIALIYFCWAKEQVKLPVLNDLFLQLQAWNIALKQMSRDGIHVTGRTEKRFYIKDKALRNFINQDIMSFFYHMKGLFEEQKNHKVKITYHNGNAHVEVDK